MNNETQKKEDDWETPTRKVLALPDLLKRLQEYPKDEMTQKLVDDIQKFITHDNCTVVYMKNINAVASSLCAWVCAMDKYYNVNLIVKPKKAALEIAEREYAELNAELNIKKENLRVVQERVARL